MEKGLRNNSKSVKGCHQRVSKTKHKTQKQIENTPDIPLAVDDDGSKADIVFNGGAGDDRGDSTFIIMDGEGRGLSAL
jgi:hypothetical protein